MIAVDVICIFRCSERISRAFEDPLLSSYDANQFYLATAFPIPTARLCGKAGLPPGEGYVVSRFSSSQNVVFHRVSTEQQNVRISISILNYEKC